MASGWEFIEKLRARPEPARRRLAFWSASLLTLAIVLGWLASGPLDFTPTEPAVVVTASSTSPLGQWWSEHTANIIAGWNRIKPN